MTSSIESGAPTDPLAAAAPSDETSTGGRIMGAAIRQRLFGQGASREPARIGRFVVTKCVGEGGMGSVYRAFDPDLERWVAVKVFRGGSDDPSARSRMIREGQAMARVTHPNVVTVFEVGTTEVDELKRVYVAMEFVFGCDLATWAREHPVGAPGRWRRALELLLQAARGLVAAHAAGLVHRDFKPANVMVGDDDRVRVADFGLAFTDDTVSTPVNDEPIPVSVVARGITKTAGVWGTPAYMSPEQRMGERIDARADQFSFCVSAWEVLYGVRPRIGLGEPLPDPSVQARVPAWVRGVLRRGLAEAPGDRYASMNELVDALGRDPTRARRRIAAAVIGSAAIGACVIAYRHDRAQRCADAGEPVQSAWTPAASEALRRHGEGSSNPGAAPFTAKLGDTLDAYAADWTRVSTDVCEAAELRGELGPNDQALALACLDDRLTQLRALAEVLDEPDANVVGLALELALRMRSPDDCAAPELSQRQPPLPDDPAAAEEVASIRGGLATARALRGVGRDDDAHELGEQLVERAQALDYPPVLAEALLERGRSARDRADRENERQSLETAYWTALRASHDAVAAQAATLLLQVALNADALETAEMWLRYAEVLADRSDLEPHQRIILTAQKARLQHNRGDVVEAEATMKQAVDEAIAIWGDDHPAIARTLGDYAITLRRNGKREEAIAVLTRAIAIEEAALGKDWSDLASPLANLGNVLDELERFDEARVVLERAHDLHLARWGPDHREVIGSKVALARFGVSSGDLDAALAAYRAAAADYRRTNVEEGEDLVIVTDLNVAFVLALDSRCDEALELLPSVVERYEALQGPSSTRASLARSRRCQCEAIVHPNADGPARCEAEVARMREHYPDQRARFEAEDSVARELLARGDLERAMEWIEELERQRSGVDEKARLANAMQLRARVLVERGEHEEAVGLSRAALALFERSTKFVVHRFEQRLDHLIVLRKAGRDDADATAAALEYAHTENQRRRVEQAGRAMQ